MGIYLFDTDVLVEALDNDQEDFGRSVIPQTAARRRMSCFPFDGYWEDVGTIAAFYHANMDWRAGRGIAAMFRRGASIITHSRQLAPARIERTRPDKLANWKDKLEIVLTFLRSYRWTERDFRVTPFTFIRVDDSLIADGCHIHADRIARSIVGVRGRIGDGTVVEDSIVMGNDADEGPVPFELGSRCRIRRAIIDKNAILGDGTVIDPPRDAPDADHELFSIRSGIVVVPRTAVLPPGTRI